MLGAKKIRYIPALLSLMVAGTAGTISASVLLSLPALSQNIPPNGRTVVGQEVFPRGAIIGTASSCFLKLQDDGNLVLYSGSPTRSGFPRSGSTVLWASNTNGRAVEKAVMQLDGNFVLYGYDGKPVWASNTEGNPSAWLIVQEDCNVVIYVDPRRINRPDGRPIPVWATNTNR